jgi:hypothetical protein
MTTEHTRPSNFLNWLFFFVSLPIAISGIYWFVHNDVSRQNWYQGGSALFYLILPLYFYGEVMKSKEGYTKVVITKDKLWKCRVSGTDEIFYVKGDTEAEVELFFETMMGGKNVFIEEANINLMSFDMEIPKEKE